MTDLIPGLHGSERLGLLPGARIAHPPRRIVALESGVGEQDMNPSRQGSRSRRREEFSAVLTPDQRLRVFVSSTLGELAPERLSVREAVERLHLTPVMFDTGARPHPPRMLYRAYLEQSDVFVGIYWERYGWVVPDMGISGLEDEYVLSQDKPRLVYIKSPATHREPRLQALIDRIEVEGAVSYQPFETTAELEDLVASDLAHLLSERFLSHRRPSESLERGHALPTPLTKLVGREDALERLASLLTKCGDIRWVTLTGVGGIGKSRLALALACRLRASRDRAVHFADLAALTDPTLFAATLAAEIGLPRSVGRPVLELVKDYLRDEGPAVLILDNFEQILDATSQLTEILEACPSTKALVTSRTPLWVRGEHQFPVDPLATPSKDAATLEHISSSPSVQLFVARAQAVAPGFVLDQRNAESITALCCRLDGLPLALELVAARVCVLSPSELLTRLGSILDLAGHTDHPPRQRTLRATIDWSYRMLAEDRRALLARLGVFSGGWNLDAAQAICGIGPHTDILDGISSLLEHGLVAVDSRTDFEPRFRMLATVREYARERLIENGELAVFQRRHAEYFAAFCDEAGQHIYSGGQRIWNARLDNEVDNVRALGRWALEGGDAALVTHAWSAIWGYWWLRGLGVELGRAINQLEARLSGASPRTHAEHGWCKGACMFLAGEFEKSRHWLRRAVDLGRESGEERLAGLGLTLLGACTPYEIERDREKELLEQAIAIFRGLDWPFGISFALAQLGVVALRDGRLADAVAMHQECVEIGRRLDDDSMTALALDELAGDLLVAGDTEAAVQALSQSAELCRSLENREALAYCLEGFAGAALRRGDTGRAAVLVGAARRQREMIGATVWPLYVPLAVATATTIRNELGAEEYRSREAEGRTLSAEQALSFALQGAA